MLYQVIVAAGLLLILANLILNLRNLKKPNPRAPLPEDPPLVSVLIPARDEEENIGACLRSLQQQDYPNFEVLVLDDNSTDKTAEVVSGFAAEDSRIRLIHGLPLPEGWAGKPFACRQLARHARGTWLLFVDADTVHAPNMIRSVMEIAIKERVSLLSGFPRQLADAIPQKIAVPLIYFILMSWVPLWWIHRSSTPRPSVAIGQFMLFPREEYFRLGGHDLVKSRVLEDIWMGIEVTRRGGRHLAIDLSPVVACNMYPTAGAMWHGLVRCLYSVTAISPVLLVFLLPVAWIFYMGPFYWFWNGFFATSRDLLWRGLVAFQVVLVVLMRWLVDRRFKEPGISCWLHPVGISYLYVVVLYALVRYLAGAGVTWKERLYGEEKSSVK
ncbi:MAG: glycosyltransferase [Dehalococcoidales bacterium]|nr:glycosyltransferase [Dehalococcoidales bacterium]